MVRQHVIDEENANMSEVNGKFLDSGIPPAIKEAMAVVERAANDPVKLEALRNEFQTLEKELTELEVKKDELESRRDKVRDVLDNSREVSKALSLVKEAILEAK